MKNETREKLPVYLEVGSKRTIASALDWPGWFRSARTEEQALQALIDVAPSYAAVIRSAGLSFDPPRDVSDLRVVDRFSGGGATDFGVPEMVSPADDEPLDAAELARLTAILRACWGAFDRAVEKARGKELAQGPRGGGRELDAIVEHVRGAEEGYSRRIGLRLDAVKGDNEDGVSARRELMIEGMAAIADAGTLPPGPRGGKRWSARYFARRVAYHLLDHVWEIEERSN